MPRRASEVSPALGRAYAPPPGRVTREHVELPMPAEYRVVRAWPTEDVVRLYESAGWWRESEAARAGIAPMIAGSFAFLVVMEGGRAIAMGRAIADGASDAYIQDV